MGPLSSILAVLLTVPVGAPGHPGAIAPHSVGRPKAEPPTPTPTPPPSPAGACIDHWLESRYRPFGYDHIVHIRNRCKKTADCSIITDVNPQPTLVSVPVRAEVEAVTWIASPARAFSANVACKLAG